MLALRKRLHRGHVGAGTIEVSERDAAIRTQVQQIKLVLDAQTGRRQRLTRLLNGFGVLTGPGEVSDLSRGG